jgi:tyrosyl-tRNA synthetase
VNDESDNARSRILDDLSARGLRHDNTDEATLRARLAAGPITLYCGFDPTADSLHVGNLVGLLALRRFQLAGHNPIVLAGGGTGLVGDPSGKSDERNLLDAQRLAENLAGVGPQLELLLDFSASNAARLVDNADWLGGLSLIAFLRDTAKHFTVNQLVARESVRARMNSESGISFTEFSYGLLQAYDFAELHRRFGCELQIGGSDQWGNIVGGIDLIRKTSAAAAYGLTWPLLTRADGKKYGKTEDGAVWLSARRTSRYQFFQYWVNLPDADITSALLTFSLRPLDELRAVVETHEKAPEQRHAQRELAREMTDMIHGSGAGGDCAAAAAVAFGSAASSAAALEMLVDELPTRRVAQVEGLGVVDLLVSLGSVGSKGEARRAIQGGGVRVGGRKVESIDESVTAADVEYGRFVLVRRGKRDVRLVVQGVA